MDAATRQKVVDAFERYLTRSRSASAFAAVSYNIKDIVARRGVGIGSAGLPSYNLLVEGPTQALENDIIIYMKQAQVAAPSRVVTDPKISGYFEHDGHRTVLSQRALQAYADPWLGYTTHRRRGPTGGRGLARTPPTWSGTTSTTWTTSSSCWATWARPSPRSTACRTWTATRRWCRSPPTRRSTRRSQGKEDAFVQAMVDFGQGYGAMVRDDYRLFIDAFRNHQIAGV